MKRMLAVWLTVLALVLCSQAFAQTKKIVVFAPHPDDESLMASGIIQAAKARGDSVTVVVVTNGDFDGASVGLTRQGETINAGAWLGLAETDVIFLGYGDGGLMQLYSSTSPTAILTSNAGLTATYGNRGLGGMDYHKFLTGVSGDYNRQTILSDFTAILTNFTPDDIYSTGANENHPDHQATYLFMAEALLALRRAGTLTDVRVHEGMVHSPCEFCDPNIHWPEPEFRPLEPNREPSDLNFAPLNWDRIENVPVPASMQDLSTLTNVKYRAIGSHSSQGGGWLFSFVKKNELFWIRDYRSNLALLATVTASSQNTSDDQRASKAIDGIHTGYPIYHPGEWSTVGQLAGAWIRLTWPEPVVISRIVLFDRPNKIDNILAGVLTFSDGSTVDVGPMDPNGKDYEVALDPKTTTFVQFTVTAAVGINIGLSEFEAFGIPSGSTENYTPLITLGPLATPPSITDAESVSLTVDGYDADLDELTYDWISDGGFLISVGPESVFFPDATPLQQIYTVKATATDPTSKSASNSTFIAVNPVLDWFQVDPSYLIGGASATGTVNLNTPAPVGGAVVTITNSSPSIVTAPASVVIPEGQTSAQFGITSVPVDFERSIRLTASWGGATQASPIAVAPATELTLATITLDPTSVIGVQPSTGTVSLSGIAPAEGAMVSLLSNDPSVTVPPFVTVPAGQSTANFTVNTTSVDNPIVVTITGTYAGDTQTATLDVTPFVVELQSFSLLPTSLLGGNPTTGSVTLNGPAPTGGTVVTLSSNSPYAVVPASVTVPQGTSGTTFTVDTNPTATPATATISATYSDVTMTAVLDINASVGNNLASLASVTVSSQNTAAGQLGIKAIDGVLDGYPGDFTKEWATVGQLNGAWIRLTWSSPVSLTKMVLYDRPNTIDNVRSGTLAFSDGSTIPIGTLPNSGTANSINFPLRTVDWVQFTINTAVGTSIGLMEIEAYGTNLTVVSGLSLNPTTVVGGNPSTATVTITAAAPVGGAEVALSSNNAVANLPATVTIPEGSTSTTFQVSTSAVSAISSAEITATYNGGSQLATLTVNPPTLSALSLNPATVTSGAESTGTVTLSGPAPTGGVVVSLSSADTNVAQVPASVAVAAGNTTATFQVTTGTVASSTQITLSASYGSDNPTAILTVNPAGPVLNAVALELSTVTGGTGTTGTVTLDTAAPAGGALVALSSDSASAQVPADVTVLEGATTATFSVTTSAVGSATTATITASFNGVTQTAGVTINPPALTAVSVNPTTVAGGTGSTGTVTIGTPAAVGGVVVTLSSDNVAAQVPADLTVLEGATTADFAITTSAVGTATTATITASFNGVTQTAGLTINPPAPDVGLGAPTRSTITASTGGVNRTVHVDIDPPSVASLSLNPTSVQGGTPSTGTVTLNGPAPTGGRSVTLSSSNTNAATVPASVTVPAGATSVTFTVTSKVVAATLTTTISGTQGVTATAVLTVTP